MILGQEIIYNFAMFISKIMDDQNLSDEQFKRRFGVYKQTYRKMVESVKSVEADSNSPSKRGHERGGQERGGHKSGGKNSKEQKMKDWRKR